MKTDSIPSAGHDSPSVSPSRPMAAAGSTATGRTPIFAPVILGAIASATGTYGGASVLIPTLAGLLMAWLCTKLGKPRDVAVVTAVAVFFGHFAWILAGTLLLATWDTVPDLLIMVVLTLWLWFHPDRWSAGATLIYSMFTLAHAVIDLNEHSFGDPAHRALVTHMTLRLAVIVPLMGAWWYRQLGQVPRQPREGSAT
jgi:hypothetical protein